MTQSDVVFLIFQIYIWGVGLSYAAVVAGTFFGAADVCTKSYEVVATRVFHCLFWSLWAALFWPGLAFISIWALYYNTVAELKGK